MLTTILNSTVLALTVLLAVASLRLCFGARTSPEFIPTSFSRILGSRLFLAIVICGGVANSASRIYLGYIAPADYGQDIVAARKLLARENLYPPDFRAQFQTLLRDTPPPLPFGNLVPRLVSFQRRQLEYFPTLYVAQAHPPFVAAIAALLVLLFGDYGSFLAMSFISIAAILAGAAVVQHALGVKTSARTKTLLAFAILGWAPFVATLRQGQTNALISLLIIVAWFFARSGRPVLAGIAIGMAANLKLYPALLLVYFVFRHRRALIAGILTTAAIPAAVAFGVGVPRITGFLQSAKAISAEYGLGAGNFSLTARIRALFGNGTVTGNVVEAICGAVLVLAAVHLLRRPSGPSALYGTSKDDLAFAMLVCASLLLTPICGSHYFVILLLPIMVLFVYAVDFQNAAQVLLWTVLVLCVSLPDPPIMRLDDALGRLFGNAAATTIGALPTWAMLTTFFWLWKSASGSSASISSPAVT